jgi:hypothetical protein
VERKKTFELRIEDDRKFTVGDRLHLKEWDRVNQKYTGRDVQADVIHILRAEETTYLQQGVACLSLKVHVPDDKIAAGAHMLASLEELIPIARRYKDEMTTFGAGTEQKIKRAEDAMKFWTESLK